MHTADTALTALESLAADLLTRCETIRAATTLPDHQRLHRAADLCDDASASLAEITRNIPMTDTLTLDNAPPPAAPPAKLTLAQAVLAEAEKQSLKHRQRSLTTDEQVGIARAFSTRGKGILLARSPSEPWARAAWNGLQPNAFKVSIGACLFLPDGPREFLTFLTDHVPLPATADRDSAALQAMGVWR